MAFPDRWAPNDGESIMLNVDILTADLLRAARVLVRLSARELSERSGVSLPTIQRIEGGQDLRRVRVDTLQKLVGALDDSGVEFLNLPGGGPGVRFKNGAPPVSPQEPHLPVSA